MLQNKNIKNKKMKKTITLSILAVLFSLNSMAHGLQNLCWANGLYNLKAIDAPVGGTMTVSLIDNTGSYNVTLNVTSSDVIFTVPQPNQFSLVHVWVVYSDGITNQIWTDSTACINLPVILENFNVAKQDNSTILTWKSSFEFNVSRFIIERSSDNINFKEIGKLSPNNLKSYSIIDLIPNNGINYYRLKVVDNDGKFKYSEIKKIDLTSDIFIIYPNPVKDKLCIQSNLTNQKFLLTDSKGSVLLTGIINKGTNVINFEKLGSGFYLLKINSESYKLIKN